VAQAPRSRTDVDQLLQRRLVEEIDGHLPGAFPGCSFIEADRVVEMGGHVEDRPEPSGKASVSGECEEGAADPGLPLRWRDEEPGNNAQMFRWPARRGATERHHCRRASRLKRDVADDAPLRLSYPGAESIPSGEEDTQVVGTAGRVTIDSVDYMRKMLARIEITAPPDPQLHGESLLPGTEAVSE
jgi:hypothetical protein